MPEKSTCPINAFQRAVGGKHRLKIIWELQQGPLRYGQLKRAVLERSESPVAERVLARELKALVTGGLIERQASPDRVGVEYHLTHLGESLLPVLSELGAWTRSYLKLRRSTVA